MSTRAAVPLAIVIGCGMIAAATYCGLTRGSDPPARAVPPAPASEPMATLAPRVRAQAAAGLEAARHEMAAACLGDAGTAALTISMGFDATGREVLRGIARVGPGPDDVPQCLRPRFPPALRIPPPGRVISVEVPFELR